IVLVPPARWLEVLVATAVIGRWSAEFLQALGDPITGEDGRRSLVATPTPAWLTAALGVGVAALTVGALGVAGLVVVALIALAAFAVGLDAQGGDGGRSAAVVAVAAAIGELVVLLAATLR